MSYRVLKEFEILICPHNKLEDALSALVQVFNSGSDFCFRDFVNLKTLINPVAFHIETVTCFAKLKCVY